MDTTVIQTNSENTPANDMLNQIAYMGKIQSISIKDISIKLKISVEDIEAYIANPRFESAYRNVISAIAHVEKYQNIILEMAVAQLPLGKMTEQFIKKSEFQKEASMAIIKQMQQVSSFQEKITKHKLFLIEKMAYEYVYHNLNDLTHVCSTLDIDVYTASFLQKDPLYLKQLSKSIDILCQDQDYITKVSEQAVSYKSKEEIVNETRICIEAVERILNNKQFIYKFQQYQKKKELPPKKSKAIQLLVEGCSRSKAAKCLDIDRATLWRWEQETDFQVRYREVEKEGNDAFGSELSFIKKRAIDTLKSKELSCLDAIRILEKGVLFYQQYKEGAGKQKEKEKEERRVKAAMSGLIRSIFDQANKLYKY